MSYYAKYLWPLPDGDTPSVYTPFLDEDELEPCEYGYHLATCRSLYHWYDSFDHVLFLAEPHPDAQRYIIHDTGSDSEKVVVGCARLLRRLDCDGVTASEISDAAFYGEWDRVRELLRQIGLREEELDRVIVTAADSLLNEVVADYATVEYQGEYQG